MRLVGVTEVERLPGAIQRFARPEAFEQFMQSKTADDPLGRCSDIGLEESLQGATV